MITDRGTVKEDVDNSIMMEKVATRSLQGHVVPYKVTNDIE